jgi:acyl-[acyl-carrier-protein]-phospholipid O-acyltransferase/long-chain-fatty-acid--[acyl-carrier-protein] ligase
MNFFSKLIARCKLTSFGYLNATQFLGAMNDNIVKLLIAYCFIQAEGTKSSSSILALVGAIYVIPFLLLSQTAGMLADRYSKRTIIVITKLIELGVMLFTMIALAFVSKFLALTALFLLSAHSALFGPCKYGIVPEIVPKEKISKANGLITSCTYTAIIIGTFLASFLTEITNRHFVYAAGITACFSLIGVFTSLQIQKTAPSGSERKVTTRFIAEFMNSMRIIRREPSLLTAVLGSAYFLFVGSFIQLNMIPFSMHSLHLTDVQGGYLFLLTALGIGAGSLLAGKFSGKAVELGLVPIGGIGMTICCFLLDFWSQNLTHSIILVMIIGAFGGLYLVPLDSYIQITAPKVYRGQTVATTNILGFFGVLCSAATLYILSDILHFEPRAGFSVIGILTLIMVTAITISISGYVVRFFSYLVSKVHFPVKLRGQEKIPLDKPSFFFVPQSYWPWSMVLLASQRRRMRLFSFYSDQDPSFLARIARRFLPILEVIDLNDLSSEGEHSELIMHSLERGTSVGIFCSKESLPKVIALSQGWKERLPKEEIPTPLFFTLDSHDESVSSQFPSVRRDTIHATIQSIP